VKLSTNGGESDVDDIDVETHDEQAHAADEEHPDAPAPVERCGLGHARDYF
jgi:hypothetical protein